MTEMDIIDFFYDALRTQGLTRDLLFLDLDETAVGKLSYKLGYLVRLADIHRLADICIANEWIQKTTVDPNYRYLALTEAGLQVAILNEYKVSEKQ